MKNLLLCFAIGASVLTSCSTAYKSGQTPDDVYYSPGTERGLTAREEYRQQQEEEEYMEYISSADDRYLRMKVANRARWEPIDDYSYWYDSRYDFAAYNYNNYGYGYYNDYAFYNRYSFYNPWMNNFYFGLSYNRSPFWGGGYYGNYYNAWNNPYYTLVNYGYPKFGQNRGSNAGSILSAFKNQRYNNLNNGSSSYVPGGNNNNSNFGNLLKKVFSTSSNGTQNSYERPVRTFENNSNGRTTTPSSNAGGTSGGFKSTGSSTSTGRGGRG